jgi:hypothetical protein
MGFPRESTTPNSKMCSQGINIPTWLEPKGQSELRNEEEGNGNGQKRIAPLPNSRVYKVMKRVSSSLLRYTQGRHM